MQFYIKNNNNNNILPFTTTSKLKPTTKNNYYQENHIPIARQEIPLKVATEALYEKGALLKLIRILEFLKMNRLTPFPHSGLASGHLPFYEFFQIISVLPIMALRMTEFCISRPL